MLDGASLLLRALPRSELAVQFPILISPAMRPLFAIFGFRARQSYVALDDDGLSVRFGTANEHVPLPAIRSVARQRWPFYYGLGPKLGPSGTVAYVGSYAGVVRIAFADARPMNVWGPFARREANGVIVSLEDADAFVDVLRSRLPA